LADAHTALTVLRQEWEHCTRCKLGEIRLSTGGAFVFGEGTTTEDTIMFVGEGPGREENEAGRPFVGKSGRFLRGVIQQVGIKNYYITNTVCCRSFVYATDSEGKPRYTTSRRGVKAPMEQDAPPTVEQRNACLERLYAEIRIVNPRVIVMLGGTAAETLLGHSVRMHQEAGIPRPDSPTEKGTVVRIPGIGYRAVYTNKGHHWVHAVKKQRVMNTERVTIDYQGYILVHPAYVLRSLADDSLGSPKDLFASGIARIHKDHKESKAHYKEDAIPDAIMDMGTVQDIAYQGEEE
jgi:uracil-DNA glycosylase